MEEVNKDIANEELGSLFSSNMMSFVPNILTSASSNTNPIPGVESIMEESGSVVNNNVNVNLNVSNGGQNSINNYSKLNNEISKFLNVQNVTDPLDLKKNYQPNLKIENINILSNPLSAYNSTNYNSDGNENTSNTNIINSNITNVSSSMTKIPEVMSMFAAPATSVIDQLSSNVIMNQSQSVLDNLPSIQNINESQGVVNQFFNNSSIGTAGESINQSIQNNSFQINPSDDYQSVQNNSFQINPSDNYQSVTNNSFISNDTQSNLTNFTNNSTTNQSNTVSIGNNSQQQIFGNYSNVIVENRATYKPLERMDSDPNPVFSNGEREIESRISPNEKIHSIENRIQELEKVELESRNINNENTNSSNSLESVFNEVIDKSNIFDDIGGTTRPKVTSNINDRSMKENTISVLFNKMNSPPIWRTVLG